MVSYLFVFQRTVLVLLVTLAALSSSACRPKATGRPKVAVSFFPLYDLTRRIAGPDADVVLLVAPGVSEHAAKVGAAEQEKAANVRLGVVVGLGLDTGLEAAIRAASPSARIIKAGDRVPTLTTRADGGAEAIDPHVWLDPARARLLVRAIVEELGRADASHALDFRARATELDRSLGALDTELEARTKEWKSRQFLPFHGAFGYFADRYGLEQVGACASLPPQAPNETDLRKTRAIVDAKHLRVLFREPQLDTGALDALVRGTSVTLGTLDPLGGQPGKESYESLLRANTEELAKALR